MSSEAVIADRLAVSLKTVSEASKEVDLSEKILEKSVISTQKRLDGEKNKINELKTALDDLAIRQKMSVSRASTITSSGSGYREKNEQNVLEVEKRLKDVLEIIRRQEQEINSLIAARRDLNERQLVIDEKQSRAIQLTVELRKKLAAYKANPFVNSKDADDKREIGRAHV